MRPFKPKRVVVIGLWAEDVPTAVHFYRDVVGLPLLSHHGERPHLVILKGQPASVPDPGLPRFPLITFAVDDLDAAVEHLQAHAIELPWGVEEGVDSRWVIFHDPAKNSVGLGQFEETAADDMDV